MKRLFVFAALVLAAAVSCTKEIAPVEKISVDVVPDNYVPVTLTATFDSGTKTIIDGKTIIWEVGESVAVFADGAGNPIKFDVAACNVADGVVTATISGAVPAGTKTFTAAYPYMDTMECTDGVVTLFIPANQYIPSGMTYDPTAFPSVAYFASAEAVPTFRNVMSYVNFKVGQADDVSEVRIYYDGEVNSAGAVEVKVAQDNSAPVITNKCDTFTSVFANDGFEPGKVYTAVVAPAKSAGISSVVIIGNKAGMRQSEKELNLERNKGLNLGDVTEDTFWNYYQITDATELAEFLAGAPKCPKSWNAVLLNDIDCAGVEIGTAESYAGVFDGQGCSLKNWTSNAAPLFALSTGTIKNFTIDESCKLIPPAELSGAVAFVVCLSRGVVSGIINNADVTGDVTFNSNGGRTAVIVGQCAPNTDELKAKGLTVSNCVNNGNVTLNTVANEVGTQYVGTIVGSMGDSAQNMLIDCVNNGNLTVNCSGSNPKNFYIGGVAGGTTNGSNNVNLVNNGDVTFNTAGHEAALCLAGISSYTTGMVQNCINNGDITFNSAKRLKATFVAGIAGYFASNKMSECVNYGDVTVVAESIGGRNGIGDINSKTYNGTNAISAGLSAGGLVSATGRYPEFEDCSNFGKVSVTLNNPANNAGTHTAARPSVGGLVGDCAGPMLNCDNYGDVEAIVDNGGTPFTPSNAGYTFYVGGIVGSGYNFSGPTSSEGSDKDKLNKFTLENCNNSGNVYYKTDSNHANTNNAVGGVCGWPGTEGASTPYTAKNCTNSGNVTVDVHVKIRVGGVHGGIGRMEGCSNTGDVTIVDARSESVVGSLAGMHYLDFPVIGCTASGKVEAKVTVDALGGLIGCYGNSETSNIYGCSVNCELVGNPAPAGKTGLIVGKFNGKTKPITIGTESDPIVIDGSVDGTALSSENVANYFCGVSTLATDGNHKIYYSFGGQNYVYPALQE